jgi:prolyl oligopeptidase
MNDPGLPNLARPDDDPWAWLEEVEGARALAWVEARNAETLARLSGRFEADEARLRAAMDRPGKLPHVTRRGPWLYNFWRDAEHPRGLWRRTMLDSFRRDEPGWQPVLDLDDLARREGEDWVWGGATTRPGAHDRALLRLSRGGSDAATLREFDVEAGEFVAGGFELPEQKGGAAWLDRDTLVLSTSLGGATRSGYARAARLWRRGSAPLAEAPIFEVGEDSMSGWAEVDPDAPGRLTFGEQLGFYTSRVWVGGAAGPKRRVELPEDSEFSWHRDFLALRLRSPWLGHAADTLLGIGFEAFLAGSRDFAVLTRPAPRRALQGFFWAGGALVASELDDLRPRHTRFEPREGWRAAPLPGAPEQGVASVWPLDAEAEESDGALLLQAEDPVTPPRLLLLEAGAEAPALLREATPAFDGAGLSVARHDAVAADGQRIPYFQIGPAETQGDAPVLLYGYGGFRIPILPNYAANSGIGWLAHGGTLVLACVRGGGEFGTSWHEAGVRQGKRVAQDDFSVVAADLVARGVTVPARIAAMGGSNGGLLVGNMLARHPEKFGAVLCTIPLLDMRRYTKLLAGASWVAEYGDPDDAEDWAFLSEISAYHLAEAGRAYPPMLLVTTRRDDRVHPGHARKMAAKLRALGHDTALYEAAGGGHGMGRDNAEAARTAALGYAFLRGAIGLAEGT